MDQKISVIPEMLKRYSLFGGLTEDQIKKILPFLEQRNFAAGDVIMEEGQSNDRVYFILEGRVQVGKNNVALVELGEGDAFGEMEIIEIMTTVARITALTDLSTISLSNKDLYKIYKLDVIIFSMIIMNLARELSRRLRRMDNKAAGELE